MQTFLHALFLVLCAQVQQYLHIKPQMFWHYAIKPITDLCALLISMCACCASSATGQRLLLCFPSLQM